MQRRKNRTSDIIWASLLAVVGCLFVYVVFSPELRRQLGGKWSVPFVGVAFLLMIYLQPTIQRMMRRWSEHRRDLAEKKWWAEREKRERAAHIRTEAMRKGKIPHDR